MKHTFNTFLLSILTLLFPQEGHAAPTARAVRLLGSNGVCTTGRFLSPTTIVTTYHSAILQCPDGECPGLKVELADTAGGPFHALEQAPVRMTVPLAPLDLAILTLPSPVEGVEVALVRAPRADEALEVVGFPRCGALESARGRVTGVGRLHATTDASGTYGNSGSPVFGSDGALLGIVDQGASLGALASAAVRGKMALRFVRADLLQDLEQLPPEERCRKEGALLLDLYRMDVVPRQGAARLFWGSDFMESVDRWLECARSTDDPQTLRALTTRGDRLSYLAHAGIDDSSSPLARLSELLVTAYNIERGGPNIRLGVPADEKTLLADRGASAHVRDLTELVKRAKESRYSGFELAAIVWGVIGGCVALLTAVLWGLSAGIVYFRSKGRAGARLAITVLVQLAIWPLSLVPWFIFGRRKRAY